MTEPMTREEALALVTKFISSHFGFAQFPKVTEALTVLSAPVPVGEVEPAWEFAVDIDNEGMRYIGYESHFDRKRIIPLIEARDAAITVAAERRGYERALDDMATEYPDTRSCAAKLRSKLNQKKPT